MPELWRHCLSQLENIVDADHLLTFVHPLQAAIEQNQLQLFASNEYMKSWLEKNLLVQIQEICQELSHNQVQSVKVRIGTLSNTANTLTMPVDAPYKNPQQPSAQNQPICSELDPSYTFEHFIECTSNHLARAAALRVSENPGQKQSNPFYIFGGVGLGKTHLMHAIGHAILARNPKSRIMYTTAEQYYLNYVEHLQKNNVIEFKSLYREVDALLVDDVQFFVGKDRSQDEFFHTFNALSEKNKQIILTCDRMPYEVKGLEERIQSRFSTGDTVSIEPPALEERVAILLSKAEQNHIELPKEVAFYIAQHINSNVRVLEGALRTLVSAHTTTGREICIDLARNALKNMISSHDKTPTIDIIQKTIANYYKIRVSDLSSKSRTRSIARPRQIAMALAKQLTTESLQNIGNEFGGKNHSTVKHAVDQVEELRQKDSKVEEDYQQLLRILSN